MLEGTVVFQDVEFLPGPLSRDLLALVGRGDKALLRLNDPASFSIPRIGGSIRRG